MSFELHPQLQADTFHVASLELCELLLMNDARFPWCILVPRREGLRDLHEVAIADKPQLTREIDQIAQLLAETNSAFKMNVAALGNMVEQLHIHVIARQQSDTAWPGPVWGVGSAQSYQADAAQAVIAQLSSALD